MESSSPPMSGAFPVADLRFGAVMSCSGATGLTFGVSVRGFETCLSTGFVCCAFVVKASSKIKNTMDFNDL
jgi:hypothetical protein